MLGVYDFDIKYVGRDKNDNRNVPISSKYIFIVYHASLIEWNLLMFHSHRAVVPKKFKNNIFVCRNCRGRKRGNYQSGCFFY